MLIGELAEHLVDDALGVNLPDLGIGDAGVTPGSVVVSLMLLGEQGGVGPALDLAVVIGDPTGEDRVHHAHELAHRAALELRQHCVGERLSCDVLGVGVGGLEPGPANQITEAPVADHGERVLHRVELAGLAGVDGVGDQVLVVEAVEVTWESSLEGHSRIVGQRNGGRRARRSCARRAVQDSACIGWNFLCRRDDRASPGRARVSPGTRQDFACRGDPPVMVESLQASLDEAFDRFADFIAVQGRAPSVDAIDRLQEALGIDDETRRILADRLGSDFEEDFESPEVLLGLILGVSAAELARERYGVG